MATSTYDLLDSVTLSSTASSVSFTSIDQNYRDLVLLVKAASTTTSGYGGAAIIQLNGDSGSNYHYIYIRGNGSTASTSSGTTTNIFVNTLDNNDYEGTAEFAFLDYTANNKHKNVFGRLSLVGTNSHARAQVHRWANTSAITTIDILASGGTYAIGSTFYLFGIAG